MIDGSTGPMDTIPGRKAIATRIMAATANAPLTALVVLDAFPPKGIRGLLCGTPRSFFMMMTAMFQRMQHVKYAFLRQPNGMIRRSIRPVSGNNQTCHCANTIGAADQSCESPPHCENSAGHINARPSKDGPRRPGADACGRDCDHENVHEHVDGVHQTESLEVHLRSFHSIGAPSDYLSTFDSTAAQQQLSAPIDCIPDNASASRTPPWLEIRQKSRKSCTNMCISA